MSWEFKYKKDAFNFLNKRNLLHEFEEIIASSIKKQAAADIKKLHGE